MATIPPVRDTIDIFKGKSLAEVYTSYDDAGAVEPLNTYTATLAIKNSTLTTTYLSLSTTLNGNGSGIVLGADGTITIIIHPIDTAALSFTDTGSDGVLYAVGELIVTKSSSNIESYALITFRLNVGY